MSDDYETLEAKYHHALAELEALKQAVRWYFHEDDTDDLRLAMYSANDVRHAETLLKVLEEK